MAIFNSFLYVYQRVAPFVSRTAHRDRIGAVARCTAAAERNGTADAICTTSFAVHLKLKMEPIKYPLKKSKETWFQTDS